MEFVPVLGSALVAIVAYIAIHVNNSRADRRDDKAWYRKLLLENSVAFLGKMDDAQAAIDDSHVAYVDMEQNVSDREWDARAIQKLRVSIGELRSASLMLKMSCSPMTTTVVDEVNAKFQEALKLLASSRELSKHATEPPTPGFKDYEDANQKYLDLEVELLKMKPLVMSTLKSDLAEGGFYVAEKNRFGRSKNLGSSVDLPQVTTG